MSNLKNYLFCACHCVSFCCDSVVVVFCFCDWFLRICFVNLFEFVLFFSLPRLSTSSCFIRGKTEPKGVTSEISFADKKQREKKTRTKQNCESEKVSKEKCVCLEQWLSNHMVEIQWHIVLIFIAVFSWFFVSFCFCCFVCCCAIFKSLFLLVIVVVVAFWVLWKSFLFCFVLFVCDCANCCWLLLVVVLCCLVDFCCCCCFVFVLLKMKLKFNLFCCLQQQTPKIKFFQIWLFWQHKIKTWDSIHCEKKTKHNQQKKLKWEFVFCFVFEIWQKLGPKSKLQIANKIVHQICLWWQTNSDQTSLKWQSKKFKVCFDAHSQKYHKKTSASTIKTEKIGNANAVVVERTLQWRERMTQWAMSNSRAFHESILKGKDSLLSRSTSLRFFRLEVTVECCQLFVHPDRLCQLVKLRNLSHAFISTLWFERSSWTKSLPSLFCFVCAKVNKWQQWKLLCETCNNNSQNCFPSQSHPVVFVAFSTVSIKINLDLLWNRIQKSVAWCCLNFKCELNWIQIPLYFGFCFVGFFVVGCLVCGSFVKIDFCLWDILKLDTKAIVHFRFIQNSGFNFKKDLKWKLCLQTQHKRAKDTCCQSLVHFSCRSWVSHHCVNHQENMSTFVSTTWTATCTVLFIVMWESPAHFECLQCLTKMSECAKSHLVNPNTVVWRFKPRKNEFHWHHSRLTCHVGSLQTDDQHRWPSTIKHCHTQSNWHFSSSSKSSSPSSHKRVCKQDRLKKKRICSTDKEKRAMQAKKKRKFGVCVVHHTTRGHVFTKEKSDLGVFVMCLCCLKPQFEFGIHQK